MAKNNVPIIASRKILSVSLSLFFALFLIFSFLPNVFAQNTLNQAAQQLCTGADCVINSPNQIFNILTKIVRWAYTIFFVVAVFFILLAAFNFLTAQGDATKIQNARDQILWAVVAIIIALISVGAAQIIKSFVETP